MIAADGRRSLCRDAAGIAVDERDYPQAALTVCLKHTRPHHDTSTEFHTPSGPFTLVPLPGLRSSLVWVLDPAQADAIAALDDAELAAEIERASHSILGKITVEPGRGLFPLSVATARRFGAQRIALVGEAAHVIPPIGAQGLNLGLRDAASIGELAIAAQRDGGDIGGDDVLDAYEKMRRADVGSRTLAIDLLNRTLLTDFLPVQGMRGLGLYMIDRIGPLRRAVMREGVAPAAAAAAADARGSALVFCQRRRLLCARLVAELRRDRQRQRGHGLARRALDFVVEQSALDEMRIAHRLFAAAPRWSCSNRRRRRSAAIRRTCARRSAFATASRVAFGSRRSLTNSAGNPIALVKANQNFCSSAPQATSLPSLAG